MWNSVLCFDWTYHTCEGSSSLRPRLWGFPCRAQGRAWQPAIPPCQTGQLGVTWAVPAPGTSLEKGLGWGQRPGHVGPWVYEARKKTCIGCAGLRQWVAAVAQARPCNRSIPGSGSHKPGFGPGHSHPSACLGIWPPPPPPQWRCLELAFSTGGQVDTRWASAQEYEYKSAGRFLHKSGQTSLCKPACSVNIPE